MSNLNEIFLLIEITQTDLFNLKQNLDTLYTVGMLNPEIFTLKDVRHEREDENVTKGMYL